MIRPQILKDTTSNIEVAATLKNRCYQDQQKSAHEEVWCLGDSPELNNNQPPTNYLCQQWPTN